MTIYSIMELTNQAMWDKLRCGDTIEDHDGRRWSVCHINGSHHHANVAPEGATHGAEVALSLNNGKVVVRYGDGDSFKKKTRRPSGVHRLPVAA